MGDLVALADRLGGRFREITPAQPTFYFDLSCPFSYLAGERIQRLFGEVSWIPCDGAAFSHASPGQNSDGAQLRAIAEDRAAKLRLPLVWPDRCPAPVPRAMRAAARACELGAGSRFALAAGRLAFCGGFDLEAPEILAVAAAASGLAIDECLIAADQEHRDEAVAATARALADKRVTRLPVLALGNTCFEGEARLPEAAAMLAAGAGRSAVFAPPA